jgi:hypothetical protein
MTRYASTNVHMLIDRPIIQRDATTYPSFTVRDLPASDIDSTAFTLTLTGDELERQAVANALRAIAAFIEEWAPEPKPADESVDESFAAQVPA